MRSIPLILKISLLLAILVGCQSCRAPVRHTLSKDDKKLMTHIFGSNIANQIQLKRVQHQTTGWETRGSYVVYDLGMTSSTMADIIKSGLAKKDLNRKLWDNELDAIDIFRTSRDPEVSRGRDLGDAVQSGLIDTYIGKGWGLYVDNSQQPLKYFFYTISPDLLDLI